MAAVRSRGGRFDIVAMADQLGRSSRGASSSAAAASAAGSGSSGPITAIVSSERFMRSSAAVGEQQHHHTEEVDEDQLLAHTHSFKELERSAWAKPEEVLGFPQREALKDEGKEEAHEAQQRSTGSRPASGAQREESSRPVLSATVSFCEDHRKEEEETSDHRKEEETRGDRRKTAQEEYMEQLQQEEEMKRQWSSSSKSSGSKEEQEETAAAAMARILTATRPEKLWMNDPEGVLGECPPLRHRCFCENEPLHATGEGSRPASLAVSYDTKHNRCRCERFNPAVFIPRSLVDGDAESMADVLPQARALLKRWVRRWDGWFVKETKKTREREKRSRLLTRQESEEEEWIMKERGRYISYRMKPDNLYFSKREEAEYTVNVLLAPVLTKWLKEYRAVKVRHKSSRARGQTRRSGLSEGGALLLSGLFVEQPIVSCLCGHTTVWHSEWDEEEDHHHDGQVDRFKEEEEEEEDVEDEDEEKDEEEKEEVEAEEEKEEERLYARACLLRVYNRFGQPVVRRGRLNCPPALPARVPLVVPPHTAQRKNPRKRSKKGGSRGDEDQDQNQYQDQDQDHLM